MQNSKMTTLEVLFCNLEVKFSNYHIKITLLKLLFYLYNLKLLYLATSIAIKGTFMQNADFTGYIIIDALHGTQTIDTLTLVPLEIVYEPVLLRGKFKQHWVLLYYIAD